MFADNSPGYVICTEPRSGSNLLCQLLASTGVLGEPMDYFNGPGRREKGWRGYPDDPEQQLHMLLAQRRGNDGIYGFKIFSETFDRVREMRPFERLPSCRFVHLERNDLLGQAISLVRARQTGSYRSTTETRHVPHYDALAIEAALYGTVIGQARWHAFFARNAITPTAITYEELTIQPEVAVAAVSTAVGLQFSPTIDFVHVAVRVQRDDLSEVWRERFRDERNDLSDLDDLLRPIGPKRGWHSWGRLFNHLRHDRR